MTTFEKVRTKKKKAARKWWHSLPSSDQDPISLEPLRRLAIEPFVLEEGEHTYRFDGRILAAYLVSSQRFVNPLTRKPLSLEQCAKLDEHLAKYRVRTQSVARAWELCRDLGPSSEREALRAEANAVMQALFVPAGSGLSLRAGLDEEQAQQELLEEQRGGGGIFISSNTQLPNRIEAAVHSFPSLPEPESRLSQDSWTPALHGRRREITHPNSNDIANREATLLAEEKLAKERTQRSQRAAKLADAFGVLRDTVYDEDRWPAELLRWARGDDGESISIEALKRIERKLEDVVRYGKPTDLPPIRDPRQRRRLQDLVDFYCLSSDEFEAGVDARGSKYLRVRISRQRFRNQARIPTPLLSASLHKVPPPQLKPRHQTKTSSRRTTSNNRARSSGTVSGTSNYHLSRDNDIHELPEPSKNVWALLDDNDDEFDQDEATAIDNTNNTTSPRKASTFQSTADECPICLCAWGSEDTVTLQCGHKYHSECLGNWHRMVVEHQPPEDTHLRFEHVLQTTICPSCRQAHPLSAVQLPARRC